MACEKRGKKRETAGKQIKEMGGSYKYIHLQFVLVKLISCVSSGGKGANEQDFERGTKRGG
jgi:hypothetical protein